MIIIRNIKNPIIKKKFSHCITLIGNFDGIHIGHQSILHKLKKEGKKKNIPTVLIFFEPHFTKTFKKKNNVTRLMNLRTKFKYLQKWKIDLIICIKKKKTLDYINKQKCFYEIVIKNLNIKTLIIGKNFKLENKKKKILKFLKKAKKKYQFHIIFSKLKYHNQKIISSKLIRKYLKKNQMNSAKSMLGRNFSVIGRVIHGKKKARKIGFPTVNISYKYCLPIYGVFAVKIKYALSSPKLLQGIANIEKKKKHFQKFQKIEAHIFKIKKNLYGKIIEIFFLKKIRNKKQFPSTIDLKQQILKDIKKTKAYLKKKSIKI